MTDEKSGLKYKAWLYLWGRWGTITRVLIVAVAALLTLWLAVSALSYVTNLWDGYWTDSAIAEKKVELKKLDEDAANKKAEIESLNAQEAAKRKELAEVNTALAEVKKEKDAAIKERDAAKSATDAELEKLKKVKKIEKISGHDLDCLINPAMEGCK